MLNSIRYLASSVASAYGYPFYQTVVRAQATPLLRRTFEISRRTLTDQAHTATPKSGSKWKKAAGLGAVGALASAGGLYLKTTFGNTNEVKATDGSSVSTGPITNVKVGDASSVIINNPGKEDEKKK